MHSEGPATRQSPVGGGRETGEWPEPTLPRTQNLYLGTGPADSPIWDSIFSFWFPIGPTVQLLFVLLIMQPWLSGFVVPTHF